MSEHVDCFCCNQNADKSAWGDGPWQSEPDRFGFTHAGLPCILHRGGPGAWCGYVGLSPGHPSHGKDYNDVDVDVHGGLTYASKCSGHVCHVPAPGEPDDLWWLGFDCAHFMDLAPGSDARTRSVLSSMPDSPYGIPDAHYWTLEDARAETERLAEQLAHVAVAA